jgi:hypothetical protein
MPLNSTDTIKKPQYENQRTFVNRKNTPFNELLNIPPILHLDYSDPYLYAKGLPDYTGGTIKLANQNTFTIVKNASALNGTNPSGNIVYNGGSGMGFFHNYDGKYLGAMLTKEHTNRLLNSEDLSVVSTWNVVTNVAVSLTGGTMPYSATASASNNTKQASKILATAGSAAVRQIGSTNIVTGLGVDVSTQFLVKPVGKTRYLEVKTQHSFANQAESSRVVYDLISKKIVVKEGLSGAICNVADMAQYVNGYLMVFKHTTFATASPSARTYLTFTDVLDQPMASDGTDGILCIHGSVSDANSMVTPSNTTITSKSIGGAYLHSSVSYVNGFNNDIVTYAFEGAVCSPATEHNVTVCGLQSTGDSSSILLFVQAGTSNLYLKIKDLGSPTVENDYYLGQLELNKIFKAVVRIKADSQDVWVNGSKVFEGTTTRSMRPISDTYGRAVIGVSLDNSNNPTLSRGFVCVKQFAILSGNELDSELEELTDVYI